MNALLQDVALVTLRKRRQAAALESASRRGGRQREILTSDF
jgi:hypothetical protein